MKLLLLQSVSTGWVELLAAADEDEVVFDEAAAEDDADEVVVDVPAAEVPLLVAESLLPAGVEVPSALVVTAVSDEPVEVDESFGPLLHPAKTNAAKALRSKMLPVDFFIFVTLLSWSFEGIIETTFRISTINCIFCYLFLKEKIIISFFAFLSNIGLIP